MTHFPVHTQDTAPERSRPILAQVEKAFGFVPNLAGMLAEAPAALEGYLAVAAAFGKSSLSKVEQQVVLLATSVENGCRYCVAAHSMIAAGEGMPEGTVTALRSKAPLAEARLETLRRFTVAVVRNRGWVADELGAFLEAGFTRANALEVITGVTQKTLSNYANHLAETPVDAAFEPHAWATA
ncbi:MAG: carboxymuconolactone decarboxylase family protein [Gemmatimonadales bacterium]